MSEIIRKQYAAEFKRSAVAQMANCPNISALAQRLGVRRKFLYLWRDRLQRDGEAALGRAPGWPAPSQAAPSVRAASAAPPDRPARQIAAQRQRIAALERQLGQKQMEGEFFRRTFAHVRGAAPTPTDGGATASTAASVPGSRAKANQDWRGSNNAAGRR